MKFYFVHGETLGDEAVTIPQNLQFCSEPGEPVDAKRTKSILGSNYALTRRASWPELRLIPVDAGQRDSIMRLARAVGVESEVRFVDSSTPTLSAWLRTLAGGQDEATVLVCCSVWGKATRKREYPDANQKDVRARQNQQISNLLDDASDIVEYGKVLSARKDSVECALAALAEMEKRNQTALVEMRLEGGPTECLAFELESWRIDPSGAAPPHTWRALLELFAKVSTSQTKAALVGSAANWPDWSRPFKSLEARIDSPEVMCAIVDGSKQSPWLVQARIFCKASKRLDQRAIEFVERVSKVNQTAQHVTFNNPHDLHVWDEFFEALGRNRDLMPYHPHWQKTVSHLEEVALGWGEDFPHGYRDALKFPRVSRTLKSSTNAQLQALIRKFEVADGTCTVVFPEFAAAVQDLKRRHMQDASVLYTERGVERDVAIVWTSVDISVPPVWDASNWSWTGFEVFVAPWHAPNEATGLLCDVKWGETDWYLEEVPARLAHS